MSVEAQTQHQLNVIFLPFPEPGHMIPMVGTARVFAKHGVSVTIITTPANALTFHKAIESDFNCGYHIGTRVVPFPAAEVGVPDGIENAKDATKREIIGKLRLGILMIKDQIELLFQELQPDCLVTDMLLPWTVDSAEKLGIPRLHYYSSSYFSTCAIYSIRKHKPHEGLVSDTHSFTIPGLPHHIEMTPLQLGQWSRTESSSATEFFDEVYESESRSYGALYNDFHELEGDYEQLYKSTVGKTWSVGPVPAWVNKDDERKTNRGHEEDLVQETEWLNWLNSKQNESVLYVSFGSITTMSRSQFVELAHGLEKSGHSFIWVIRKHYESELRDSFLEAFEEKMKESKKGYMIWNWAPQLRILEHPAIGGFLTQWLEFHS